MRQFVPHFLLLLVCPLFALDYVWENPRFGVDYYTDLQVRPEGIWVVDAFAGSLLRYDETGATRYERSVRWRLPLDWDAWQVVGNTAAVTVLGRLTIAGEFEQLELSRLLNVSSSIVYDGALYLGTYDGDILRVQVDGGLEETGGVGGAVIALAAMGDELYAVTEVSVFRLEEGGWVKLTDFDRWRPDRVRSNGERLLATGSVVSVDGSLPSGFEKHDGWLYLVESIDGIVWEEVKGYSVYTDNAAFPDSVASFALDASGPVYALVGSGDQLNLSLDAGSTWEMIKMPLGMPKSDWGLVNLFFRRFENSIRDVHIVGNQVYIPGNRGELWCYDLASKIWTQLNEGSRDTILNMMIHEGKLIAVGSDQTFTRLESRSWRVESDGSWTDTGMYFDGPLRRVIRTVNDDRFIAVGGGAGLYESYNLARIAESTDGLSWSPASIEARGSEHLYDVTDGALGPIAVGDWGEILHSSEAGSWRRLADIPAEYPIRFCVFFDGRYYIASDSNIWSSKDLVSWELEYTVVDDADKIVGLLLVLEHLEWVTSWGRHYAISEDRVVVERRPVGFAVKHVFSGAGQYLAIGGAYYNTVYTSVDGVQWDSFTTGQVAMLEAAVFDGSWLVAGRFGQRIRVEAPAGPHPLADQMRIGEGWVETWMGALYDLNYPWVYHETLGWVYFSAKPKGVFIWMDSGRRWAYASGDFPQFYYFFGDETGWFFHLDDWIYSYTDALWYPLADFQ